MVEVNCFSCGKKMLLYPSQVLNRGTKVTCSILCYKKRAVKANFILSSKVALEKAKKRNRP